MVLAGGGTGNIPTAVKGAKGQDVTDGIVLPVGGSHTIDFGADDAPGVVVFIVGGGAVSIGEALAVTGSIIGVGKFGGA